MKKNKLIKPVVKWAGGKRQLLEEIRAYMPKSYKDYYEPFIGGGALWLDLQPKNFFINDVNSEMINVYLTIKSDVSSLITELKTYKNDPDFFYELRELDRKPEFKNLSEIKKAARILYLNKTCFNGLFRVNSQGQFNVPFGKYKNPDFINEYSLQALSKYLNESEGVITTGDYWVAVQSCTKNSFVYFDPPYDPVSSSSSFTGYTLSGFDRNEQIRLKERCDSLHKKGVKFLLSNSSTEFIHDLYKDYEIIIVKANRAINSQADGRGSIDEVLIRNYDE